MQCCVVLVELGLKMIGVFFVVVGGFFFTVFSSHHCALYPRMENVRQCGVALCIMLGFSILTASIGSAIVKDRVSGTKRLQHITGLGYKTYWLANFCCDMVCIL